MDEGSLENDSAADLAGSECSAIGAKGEIAAAHATQGIKSYTWQSIRLCSSFSGAPNNRKAEVS